MRSQSGPGAGTFLSTSPTSPLTRIESHLFRVLLFRRLRLPIPLSKRFCRCGRQIDVFGHHRAACAQAGVLGRRGFALESVAARICREGGARVTTNVMVRDLDLGVPNIADGRRLEVVADGLSLFGGAQLALDTTMVSPLHCDGSSRRGAAERDGVALTEARRRKERTYPELVGQRNRARLVVLAAEVGGRWSEETKAFVGALARGRSRSEPPFISCAAARAFALSLLNLHGTGGADGGPAIVLRSGG